MYGGNRVRIWGKWGKGEHRPHTHPPTHQAIRNILKKLRILAIIVVCVLDHRMSLGLWGFFGSPVVA